MAAIRESSSTHPHRAAAGGKVARGVLLFAFAFAVMGDPVSSVAYAIQAGLQALGGNLALLVPTMAVVIGVVALVVLNYHQLIARFPRGGGAAAAAAAVFGEGWAFPPLGSLMVDYALTIAISVSAGASAIIAYVPSLAPDRLSMAIALTAAVAGLTWFGHGGRAVFAVMTVAFVAVAMAVIAHGFIAPVSHGHVPLFRGHPFQGPLAVILAFPVAMALATGVEAPSSAVAQLGQLDDAGRRRSGRVTLWLMVAIVATLTLGLSALAVRLRVGLPPANSTLVALVAEAAVGSGPLFAAFQFASALLLLAAANSSFNAGPGLLKALAHEPTAAGGILPAWLGRTNRHHTPYWGVLVFFAVSLALVVAAGGHDQPLVLFYAVAVFVSFLFGLLAMGSQSWRERRPALFAANALGTLLVLLTLCVDLMRIYPIASLVAAFALAGLLYARWVRSGRPQGVAAAAASDPDGQG